MTTTTAAQFRSRCEAGFRRRNPDAEPTFVWERVHNVTWADGSKGRWAMVLVSAPGFRPRRMRATEVGGAMMIR